MISCSACVFHPRVYQCSPEIKNIYCLRSTYFIGGVKFVSYIKSTNLLFISRQKINISSFKHSKSLIPSQDSPETRSRLFTVNNLYSILCPKLPAVNTHHNSPLLACQPSSTCCWGPLSRLYQGRNSRCSIHTSLSDASASHVVKRCLERGWGEFVQIPILLTRGRVTEIY